MLTPNTTYEILGVPVREKIIPDGTRWINGAKATAAGFAAGVLYKKQQKLGGKGIADFVTIHNTEDLTNVYDDGEQYTRATYNENMKSVRPHFYVDDTGAWQLLRAGTGLCKSDPDKSAEVGWHAGDGSAVRGGNMTSIALEVIMNESVEHDKKTYDNSARIAAWLLWKNNLTIDRLVTHTYWVNKSRGNNCIETDVQCTTPVKKAKWCPAYIFASRDQAKALENWRAYKAQVKSYLDALNGQTATQQKSEYKVGDVINFAGKTHYVSANAQSGTACRPGSAKITAISAGAAHPYHVIHTNKTSNVYGWVDTDDIK